LFVQCKIVFRDLKPENIVFTQRGYIKLIDLGLAKIIRGYTKTFCGTPHYIGIHFYTFFILYLCLSSAPEVIMHRPYTVSPDYWTLGVIIHEMVTGDAPYSRTHRIDSTTNEIESDMGAIENNESDIIRASSKHYNM
jgi:serine/threonine protein kinase